MHFAGDKESQVYDKPGALVAFDADLYHRSGVSFANTVKIAFFFKKKPAPKQNDAVSGVDAPEQVQPTEGQAGSSSGASAEAAVESLGGDGPKNETSAQEDTEKKDEKPVKVEDAKPVEVEDAEPAKVEPEVTVKTEPKTKGKGRGSKRKSAS